MIESNNARWIALALLFIARIGLGFQFQTLGSVSENLVTGLALDYTEIGVLIGLFMVPGMFLALPAGFSGRFASDRFIIGIGLMILAAGGFLAALAGSFELLAIGRLICGIGFVFSTIFFTKMVADWFAGKELATAMSILVMSWPLGIAMGQVGHGWIALNYDWPLAFTVASIYCFVSAFLIMIFCNEAPNIKKAAGGFQFSLGRTEIFLIFISSLIWAFFNAAYVVYLSFAPISLVADGYDTLTALSIVSLASWLMMFSISLCGFISDKSGKPDLLIYICMAGAVIALVLLIYTPLAIPSSLLFGFLGVAPAGVIMALTAEAMKPENRAIGMGLFFSIYFLIQAIAPPIAGWLFDLTNNSNWPILFAMALFAVTALTTYLFRIAVRRYPL
ncbi:MFS transporter [Sneathiella marina]|uniref:MFS transporter n=1 Tax=Sneathiella marina TaxID=2950108 RepID=A0ABY4W4Y8_9PROT|nr:MFS transporter [Sneathiella marina]USG61974.1 MFS transporter [Sneathiella marina]